MDMLLVIAAGFWFLLEALRNLVRLGEVQPRPAAMILFIYCLLVGVYLIYMAGGLHLGR